MKLEDASEVAEHIEKEIEEMLKNTRVMVKVESCDPEDLDFKRIDLTRLNGH
jgi:divalent metal cation (Fe/Co/Zn/Cd) transporter